MMKLVRVHLLAPTQRARLHQHQSGRTIIEIMIALAIGLIIVAAVMGAFVSNQQSSTQLNASAKLAQELAGAMNLIGQTIRSAGTSDLESSTAVGDRARRLKMPVVSGCDGGYALAGNDIPDVTTNTACNSSAAGNDAITLGSQVEAARCPTSTSGSITSYYNNADSFVNTSWGKDLLGQCVDAVLNPQGIPVSEVMHRFFIHKKLPTNANPDPSNNLYIGSTTTGSTGGQNAAQPVFPDVEQMKLRYLVSTLENGEGDVYMTAAQVNSASFWPRVVGVRVCLVMSTKEKGVAQTAANNYVDCNGVSVAGANNRIYRSSSALFLIRSRATPISHVNG